MLTPVRPRRADEVRAKLAAALLTVAAISVTPGAVFGQEVIELPGEDRWLEADFEEVYRIGAADGEPWEEFGSVGRVAFDGNGNLHVFDRVAARVVVVSPVGEFIREFGRRGDGPGEFRNAADMAVMADGRVVIVDMGHRAYQIFDGDGQFERMVRAGAGTSFTTRRIYPEDGGGSVLMDAEVVGWSFQAAEGGTSDIILPNTRQIERIDLTGAEVATETVVEAWAPPWHERRVRELSGRQRIISWAGSRRVFEPALLAGVLPGGGIAYSDSSAYEITIMRRDGAASRILTRPFAPEPVTEAVKRAEKDRRLSPPAAAPSVRRTGGGMVVSGSGAGTRNREEIEALEFYEEVPVVKGLHTSWNGRIWVRRRGDEPVSDGPIDVLAADGRYLGSYRTEGTPIPDAFGPGGMAAFIERDELDIQTVVVRRLPRTVN